MFVHEMDLFDGLVDYFLLTVISILFILSIIAMMWLKK